MSDDDKSSHWQAKELIELSGFCGKKHWLIIRISDYDTHSLILNIVCYYLSPYTAL